jgi:hypothetical protein
MPVGQVVVNFFVAVRTWSGMGPTHWLPDTAVTAAGVLAGATS